MKIVAVVGSESHTSSSAWAALTTVTGERIPGKLELYEDGTNKRWFLVEADLPDGAAVRYKGGGRDGNRGVNKYTHNAVYTVQAAAPVVEIAVPLGVQTGLLKGRLVEEGTVTGPAPIDRTEGF